MQVKLNITPMEDWGLGLSRKEPLLISGPCSAETEEQVLETALRLKKQKIHLLRAGIWKPRTRPNSFEGIGSPALKWLKKASKETGLPITCEVANVKHVYEALRMGVDILWLGARTTVNPFAVQEIANALVDVDIPVMVKNPVNPDLALWIGALERLNGAGITKLAAIHRGFSSHSQTRYRNIPLWEIPIEMMRRIPELPMICDPSHICGRRDILQEVSQKAMDLNFDGIMLESHINPAKALSDAKQQVVPERYGEIVDSLVIRKTSTDNVMVQHTLDDLRELIDGKDQEVISILVERMGIAERIGDYKRENGITILQPARWDELIRSRVEKGEKLGLSEQFMQDLYNAVHNESIRHQTKVMNNTKNGEMV